MTTTGGVTARKRANVVSIASIAATDSSIRFSTLYCFNFRVLIKACGVSRKDEQRIVGGRPTEAYDYPWMAGLLYKGALYCGATLINDRYVITAAHCVDGYNCYTFHHRSNQICTHTNTLFPTSRLDIDSIHVLLGGHDLENVKENELELRAVVGMVKHPKFEAKTFNNDIAILKFDDPVPFSRSIGPVCLPQSGIDETYRSQSHDIITTNNVKTGILLFRYRIRWKSGRRYGLGPSQRNRKHIANSSAGRSSHLHQC